MVDDDFSDIRARLAGEGSYETLNMHYDADVVRLLAAIDERDKRIAELDTIRYGATISELRAELAAARNRIAELEANSVDHCDSCSCNYDPTVTR